MVFGWTRASKATPAPDAPATGQERPQDAVATLSLVQPSPREMLAALHTLADDVKWLQERFDKLQARVTTELREVRREVDRFYDEPEE